LSLSDGRAGEQGRVFYGEDHFKQLLSERPVLEKGIRKWKKYREAARNEALDCRVYAMAAYHILNLSMKKLHSKLWLESRYSRLNDAAPDSGLTAEKMDPSSTKPKHAASPARIGRTRGGLVNRWR